MRRWFVVLACVAPVPVMFVACSDDSRVSPDASAMEAGLADGGGNGDVGTLEGSADSGDLDGMTCEASADDPHNCGRCGHDCIGGACEGGVCQPWTILDTPATDIASDNVQVFWTVGGDLGNVASCPRLGCQTSSVLVPTAAWPSKIAVDSTSFYYTTYVGDGGYLGSCGKGGCDGGVMILSGGHSFPGRLVVDSTAVFFDVGASNIFRCALPSCGNGATSATQTSMLRGLAQEWNILYWTENDSSIWSCVKGSCDSTRKLLVSNVTALHAVAAYGGEAYAVQGGASGKMFRCSNTPSCVPQVLAQNLEDPFDIECDPSGVYFLTRGTTINTAALNWCGLSGCSNQPLVLIGGLSNPSALAIDQDAVYVVSAAGPILGVAKP